MEKKKSFPFISFKEVGTDSSQKYSDAKWTFLKQTDLESLFYQCNHVDKVFNRVKVTNKAKLAF